jgi:hypothetical protein
MLLEDLVVTVFVLSGTDFVAADVQLEATAGVLQFGKGGFAHDTPAHQTTGQGNLLPGSRIFVAEIAQDLGGPVGPLKGSGRVRLDPQPPKGFQGGTTQELLFAQWLVHRLQNCTGCDLQ